MCELRSTDEHMIYVVYDRTVPAANWRVDRLSEIVCVAAVAIRGHCVVNGHERSFLCHCIANDHECSFLCQYARADHDYT